MKKELRDMSKAGESILQGMKQALDYSKNLHNPSEYRTHVPEKLDVKKIRKKLHMSQFEFAARYGLQLDSIRNWEQERRRPEGAARILLYLIDRDPETIEKILHN